MESVLDVHLNIPRSDIRFFGELVSKMGWEVKSKESVLQKFIDTRPKDVDLSEDEIIEEIRTLRYAK